MDDLIIRKALMKYMRDYKWEFALNSDFSKAIEMVDVQPTVEAVPKSYADQIRWERDIAIEQLNEIGCQFGQKMDEVKKKLEASQWIPCSERLPDDGENVLVGFEYFRYGHYNRLFQTTGISYVFDGEWSGFVNGSSGWSKLRIIAWMPLPEAYKGEQHEID